MLVGAIVAVLLVVADQRHVDTMARFTPETVTAGHIVDLRGASRGVVAQLRSFVGVVHAVVGAVADPRGWNAHSVLAAELVHVAR